MESFRLNFQMRPVLLTLGALLLAAAPVMAAPSDGDAFALSPTGAVTARLAYFPIPLVLPPDKPAGIVKEPAYRTTPKYGVIHIGDGPKSRFIVAVDEPNNADWKIYVDKNQNGDLTDDGDGAWNLKKDYSGRTQYGVMILNLRASYGTASQETSSSDYAVGIYRFVGTPNPFMYRQSSRNGTVIVAGKTHKAILVENDADGIFDKPVASLDEAKKSRPVWMMIDTNDDGKFASGMIDVRAPFKLGDQVLQAMISRDGSRVRLEPTTKPALDLSPKQQAAQPLLKAGTDVPEFTAEKWGGGLLKPSDYRGKVLILDFWATWCGPCQKSMPHIEKVSRAVAGQDVAVVGVCVWDEKSAYMDWVPKNMDKYTFQFAFDPAGKDSATSIAQKLFHVSGIPTTYVIDKDGKVVDAIVGYDDGDTRLEEALKKVGVKVN